MLVRICRMKPVYKPCKTKYYFDQQYYRSGSVLSGLKAMEYGHEMVKDFNLLKPTGYVMHQQFNIQQLYVLPTHSIYVFCIYLRTNSDSCHLQHKLIGFYNRDEKCFLRGTNWVFK